MVEWWRMMESPSSVDLQFFPETHNFITMNMMAFLVFLRMFFFRRKTFANHGRNGGTFSSKRNT